MGINQIARNAVSLGQFAHESGKTPLELEDIPGRHFPFRLDPRILQRSITRLGDAPVRQIRDGDSCLGIVRLRQLIPARCPLFGYSLEEMTLDGQHIPRGLLRPELQSRLGLEGYDAGAEILSGFFKEQLPLFDCEELDPLGREIIRLAMRGAPLEDYLALTPMALC